MMGTSTTFAAVSTLLEPGWLSEWLGREVTVTSLRVKPDTSVLAGFRAYSPHELVKGQDAHGWVRLLWPAGARKATRHAEQVAKLGLAAPVVPAGREFEPGSVIQTGPLAADPKLMGPLAESSALLAPGARVLRYNPARRLVIRYRSSDGPLRVVRVLTAGEPADTGIHEFVSGFVPAPPVLAPDQVTGLPALEYVGDHDLSDGQTPAQAEAAGALFAHLHASTPHLPPSLKGKLADRFTSGARQLQVHAGVLDALDSELAGRCRELAAELPRLEGDPVLVHGDASPDQVITDTSGSFWLTDFDRAHLGPAATDLGSYLATSSPEAGRSFMRGYLNAGGVPPSPDQLQRATAHSLALRLTEPLRAGQATWRTDIVRRLIQIEQLL
ncbi:phosphotransferase family protein [Rothia nasisuis]|nr:aminoglycoside phosphotransferase family protein [Rothia nasisuis]